MDLVQFFLGSINVMHNVIIWGPRYRVISLHQELSAPLVTSSMEYGVITFYVPQ